MKNFDEEEIDVTEEGESIYGFIIKKNDFEAFNQKLVSITNGQHFFAVKEENDVLIISLFLYGISTEEVNELVNSYKQDKIETGKYQNYYDDFEPNKLEFNSES